MAPFSFIKTSILIFAYLFLWHQTNYQHQVSALSTLKNDDDVSDSNSLYSSEEENVNKTHGLLKTAQGVGTKVPTTSHKGLNDDDGDDVSTLLGLTDDELLEHALSGQTPCSAKGRENSSKGIGTKIKECCKKLTHYKNKNKILLTVVLVLSVLYPLTLFYVNLFIGNEYASVNNPITFIIGISVSTVMGILLLGVLLGFYYSKVWLKCITQNAKIRQCLREEFEKVQHQQQTT
ncbi:hypothetical protein, conserved in P.knowlesi [Plasmodium knowlesi strain H]|uniref:Uncharacterized protein n=3 Tax=Plasmodium knowlesi TaxID=5850 RepID=A0A1A7VVL3_PLAKH|nr:hypothetical protein, conserved in P.knowlesi [Plasmodium knowlesi strain H]OTN64764.1 Uncharacterized protein PKNOH_S130211100 [Plasmodium knowlesi]CAA9989271.1 hypothetical protein, conserved in P.knowlesi [Plasmodium knowlesi strain H]SBO26152.1 hypothetical protein, conserved in P.knowlesi [Plasmodium knowlesi strain H]SBO26881.1 hypothetical protein, conserved in P.knowlesi [Plasmodium knowlesi strain H]VVS78745.1 hypothetical protein, conserved in P.knowlesi [Plasmodium knowlesi strai